MIVLKELEGDPWDAWFAAIRPEDARLLLPFYNDTGNAAMYWLRHNEWPKQVRGLQAGSSHLQQISADCRWLARLINLAGVQWQRHRLEKLLLKLPRSCMFDPAHQCVLFQPCVELNLARVGESVSSA
jgi:hypothetical protein